MSYILNDILVQLSKKCWHWGPLTIRAESRKRSDSLLLSPSTRVKILKSTWEISEIDHIIF